MGTVLVLTPKENPGFVAKGSPFSSIVEDSISFRPICDILVLFMPKELSSKNVREFITYNHGNRSGWSVPKLHGAPSSLLSEQSTLSC